MLTPASAHTHAAVPTTMVCKKTQAAANTTTGWISLEQATAQGCWSSPGCFSQHKLLPGRLITQITFKASSHSALSWLQAQLISHHTRCQCKDPGNPPTTWVIAPAFCSSAESGEQLG